MPISMKPVGGCTISEPNDPGKTPFSKRDLDGLSRLTVEAVTGITNMVEALHHTITHLPTTRDQPDQRRTSGITGIVYRNIRTVTKWVGHGIEPVLDQIAHLGSNESSRAREAVRASINGILGDYLADTGNSLAIPMQFRQNGNAVDPNDLAPALERAGGRLLILVHGLCMNDLQWHRKEHHHGSALARDLDIEPIYLHYNTGLHISENGQRFSSQLERLLQTITAQNRHPIEIFIIGHSMGGLVARSACHDGLQTGKKWPKHLRKMIFLGTPHQGALLEKSGNLLDNLLEISPYSAPFARIGKIRSSGITDLRYGYIAEEDWAGHDRFNTNESHQKNIALPNDVICYALAGSRQTSSGTPIHKLVGDGLVSIDSALGRHPNPVKDLALPEKQQSICHGVNHLDLLNDPDVYATILR